MVCTAWWASKEKAESTESRARANQRPRTEWRLCMDVEFLSSVRERISKQRILLRSLGGWRYVNRKNLGGWPCFHPRIAGKISSAVASVFRGDSSYTSQDHHDSASALPAMLREPSRKFGKQGEA